MKWKIISTASAIMVLGAFATTVVTLRDKVVMAEDMVVFQQTIQKNFEIQQKAIQKNTIEMRKNGLRNDIRYVRDQKLQILMRNKVNSEADLSPDQYIYWKQYDDQEADLCDELSGLTGQ